MTAPFARQFGLTAARTHKRPFGADRQLTASSPLFIMKTNPFRWLTCSPEHNPEWTRILVWPIKARRPLLRRARPPAPFRDKGPDHIWSNPAGDCEITGGNMDRLRGIADTDYGAAGAFPVFSKKRVA